MCSAEGMANLGQVDLQLTDNQMQKEIETAIHKLIWGLYSKISWIRTGLDRAYVDCYWVYY